MQGVGSRRKEDALHLQQAKEVGEHDFWVSRRTVTKAHRSPEKIHDLRIIHKKGYEFLQALLPQQTADDRGKNKVKTEERHYKC